MSRKQAVPAKPTSSSSPGSSPRPVTAGGLDNWVRKEMTEIVCDQNNLDPQRISGNKAAQSEINGLMGMAKAVGDLLNTSAAAEMATRINICKLIMPHHQRYTRRKDSVVTVIAKMYAINPEVLKKFMLFTAKLPEGKFAQLQEECVRKGLPPGLTQEAMCRLAHVHDQQLFWDLLRKRMLREITSDLALGTKITQARSVSDPSRLAPATFAGYTRRINSMSDQFLRTMQESWEPVAPLVSQLEQHPDDKTIATARATAESLRKLSETAALKAEELEMLTEKLASGEPASAEPKAATKPAAKVVTTAKPASAAQPKPAPSAARTKPVPATKSPKPGKPVATSNKSLLVNMVAQRMAQQQKRKPR